MNKTKRAKTKTIYLDNAATTRTDPDIAEQLGRDMTELYGNPSSPHSPGRAAAAALTTARMLLEKLVPGYKVVFTASGSEAINLALRGAWSRRPRGENRILISAVEHPATREAALDLAAFENAQVEEIPVDQAGQLDLAAAAHLLATGTPPAIVACMHVQNELGTLMPLSELGELIRAHAPEAFFMVDSAQGLGKVPFIPAAWTADGVALASHKIHGPKGAGALLIREDHITTGRLRPLVHGGGHELGLRSGTESVPLIRAFVSACRRAFAGFEQHTAHLHAMRTRLLSQLRRGWPELVVNGPDQPGRRSPAILSVSLRGIQSDRLRALLDADGICVSAASACHSDESAQSPVHSAAGFPLWRSRSVLRFGLSWHTTSAEIDVAAKLTLEHARRLKQGSGAAA